MPNSIAKDSRSADTDTRAPRKLDFFFPVDFYRQVDEIDLFLSSTGLDGKDMKPTGVMEGVFSLPPPALESPGSRSPTQRHTYPAGQASPPPSPESRQSGSSLQRKRTLSGGTKLPSSSGQSTENALPPPPTRSRKIIHMKPKQQTSNQASAPSNQAPEKSMTSYAVTPTASVSAPKRKAQSSTNSAAGRKIARKTAHSIIERRRRSKMNEEFGVLKDMIPACAGVEMHKLAILQAGIEYVKYLEGCVAQLKAQNKASRSRQSTPQRQEVEDEDDTESMDVDCAEQHARSRLASSSVAVSETSSPSLRTRVPPSQGSSIRFRKSSVATDATDSTYASPSLRPIQSSSSLSSHQQQKLPHLQTQPFSSVIHNPNTVTSPQPLPSIHTPTQTGVSPAFGAFHFSPDLSRTTPGAAWSTSAHRAAQHGGPSPNILPLPQAAMSLSLPLPSVPSLTSSNDEHQHGLSGESEEGHAEATATAALLMMTTTDRRASLSAGTASKPHRSQKKGMSVQDLLSS